MNKQNNDVAFEGWALLGVGIFLLAAPFLFRAAGWAATLYINYCKWVTS